VVAGGRGVSALEDAARGCPSPPGGKSRHLGPLVGDSADGEGESVSGEGDSGRSVPPGGEFCRRSCPDRVILVPEGTTIAEVTSDREGGSSA